MPRDIIGISTDELPEGVKMGAKVSLKITGTIIDVSGAKSMIEVSRVSASQSGATGRFDELLAISRRIAKNSDQMPKVKPLGGT